MKKLLLALLLVTTPAFADGLIISPSQVGVAPVGQIPAIQDNSVACTTCVAYDGNTITNSFGNLTVQPTVQSLVSKSLPAGDYEVSGWVQYGPAGATVVQYVQSSINSGTGCSTPAINSSGSGSFSQPVVAASPGIATGGVNFTATLPITRFHFSSTTTVCITSLAQFTTSTLSATVKLYINKAR